MFSCREYALLDFGDGRRLERFGEIMLNRPCPAARHSSEPFPILGRRPTLASRDATNCGGSGSIDASCRSGGSLHMAGCKLR